MARNFTVSCRSIFLRFLVCSLIISTYLLYLSTYPFKVNLSFVKPMQHLDKQESSQRDWQNVGHAQFKFWIYSAYAFEDGQVVIIGTPKPFQSLFQPITARCLFYWQDNNSTADFKINHVTTKAKIERMKGWDWRWAGTFTHCPLPNTSLPSPTFVSILLENQSQSSVRLPIKYTTRLENHPFKFSVCVLPLYNYNQVFHFLEWLEFYKLMGVQQFTFYNISIGPHTSCVLNHLKNDVTRSAIRVRVNPWHDYPQWTDSDIRLGIGLSAGANECLYSHKGFSKYMIFVDVDEFIVPRSGIQNYHQLMEHLEANITDDTKFGGFTFRNGFYFKTRDRDPKLLDRCSSLRENANDFLVCQQMWTMMYPQRERLDNWGWRTKYIAVPDGVRNAGNHYVLEFEEGWKEVNSSETLAFLRHYREPLSANLGSVVFIDRIPQEMGVQLAKNVAASVQRFINVCNFSLTDIYK